MFYFIILRCKQDLKKPQDREVKKSPWKKKNFTKKPQKTTPKTKTAPKNWLNSNTCIIICTKPSVDFLLTRSTTDPHTLFLST